MVRISGKSAHVSIRGVRPRVLGSNGRKTPRNVLGLLPVLCGEVPRGTGCVARSPRGSSGRWWVRLGHQLYLAEENPSPLWPHPSVILSGPSGLWGPATQAAGTGRSGRGLCSPRFGLLWALRCKTLWSNLFPFVQRTEQRSPPPGAATLGPPVRRVLLRVRGLREGGRRGQLEEGVWALRTKRSPLPGLLRRRFGGGSGGGWEPVRVTAT